MPRPQRKEINFSKDSILSLMQEIYNELVEQRQTAIRIQNKMLSMLKDPNDMMTIGPVIEKQQKIVNDCVEKKISLSKLQSSIWEKSNNNNNESFSLADLDDDLIQNLIDKDVSNDEETYKMKQK
jgi:methionine salvage enolase-phosphatase E1